MNYRVFIFASVFWTFTCLAKSGNPYFEPLNGRTPSEYFQEKAPNVTSGWAFPIDRNIETFQNALTDIQTSYSNGDGKCHFSVQLNVQGQLSVTGVLSNYSRRESCEKPFNMLKNMPKLELTEPLTVIDKTSVVLAEELLD